MNTPTKSGWYWARIGGEWEVVYVNWALAVLIAGQAEYVSLYHVNEWGERVERKEEGK